MCPKLVMLCPERETGRKKERKRERDGGGEERKRENENVQCS